MYLKLGETVNPGRYRDHWHSYGSRGFNVRWCIANDGYRSMSAQPLAGQINAVLEDFSAQFSREGK